MDSAPTVPTPSTPSPEAAVARTRGARRWRTLAVGLACGATTLAAFAALQLRERAELRRHLIERAEEAVALWRGQHQRWSDAVSSLAGFYESSNAVTPAEFDSFARHVSEGARDGVAYAWYERDTSAGRPGRWTRECSWPSESFAHLEQRALAPSSPLAEFAERAFGSAGGSVAASFESDLAGAPAGFARPALLSRSLRLDRERSIEGLVVVWFDASAPERLRTAEGLNLYLIDEPRAAEPPRLAASSAGQRELAPAELDRLRSASLATLEFDFGDRRRSVLCTAAASALAARSPAPWYVLGLGALATVALVLWQRASLRREQEIQRLVAERTRELREALDELDAFSYSVSHDLRAPLRALHGFSKVLLEDHGAQLDDDARRCVDAIARNAVRMGRLIDGLLRMSRTTRQEMSMQPIDLAQLVDGVWEQLEPERNGRAIHFSRGALPVVVGDRELVQQVFVNLLSNAIKFSRPRENAEISVAAEDIDGRARVRVRDNGVGFDMRYAAQLFGVFQRLHRPEEFEGTGVGLALSRRILARHGGTLSAESALGQGATFTLTLPLAAATARAVQPR